MRASRVREILIRAIYTGRLMGDPITPVKGRANALRRLGVRGRGLGVAWCSHGAWPMARHVVVQHALKTARLERAGFGIPWALASRP